MSMVTAASASTKSNQTSGPETKFGEFGFLTPDTLMDFCQSKIRGLDQQVQMAFKGQRTRNAVSSAMSNLANVLGENAKGAGIGVSEEKKKTDILDAYKEAIAAAGPTSSAGQALTKQMDAFENTARGRAGGGDAGVDVNEMKGFLDSVQHVQSDVNREGELEMIQLQSLMSQRAQALQMCTNMVAGLGQSMMSIAQNVGK